MSSLSLCSVSTSSMLISEQGEVDLLLLPSKLKPSGDDVASLPPVDRMEVLMGSPGDGSIDELTSWCVESLERSMGEGELYLRIETGLKPRLGELRRSPRLLWWSGVVRRSEGERFSMWFSIRVRMSAMEKGVTEAAV